MPKQQEHAGFALALLKKNIFPLILLICSFGIYFTHYGNPQSMFWDENYHVASAQKHVDGIMYMEPHPPLGKMLMGLAEAIIGANDGLDKHKLDETDYIKGEDAPAGMKFTGFRWPPVVGMALAVLFFYGIINRITRLPALAFMFTSLVIFDNALVIQARAAQLEGMHLFFILAAVYYCVRSITSGNITLKNYIILGLLIGLALAVKVTAAILLLLFVMLYGVDQWRNIQNLDIPALLKRLLQTAPLGVGAVALVFFAVFYVHIGMGTKVLDGRTYKASPEYLQAIQRGDTWSLSTFIVGMKDNFRYMNEYADGVPRLDECKPDENGSYALDWVLGKKTISYRWDRDTVNGVVQVKYMTIIANPIVWFSVLGGIVLSLGLIMSRFIYGNPVKDVALFYWICAFTGLYMSYMIAILQIERVMYLYHYMIPLLFGAVNLVLMITYLYRDGIYSYNRHTWINLGLYVALIIAVFAFFSPLTYGLPLTADQFEMRNWFSFWKLQVVR